MQTASASPCSTPGLHVLLTHTRMQAEGRSHRPLGVILMGYWHPEEGQEAVVGKMLDSALIVLHLLLGTGEKLLPQCVPGLGFQRRRQLRGIGESAGQYRDQLAFLVQD